MHRSRYTTKANRQATAESLRKRPYFKRSSPGILNTLAKPQTHPLLTAPKVLAHHNLTTPLLMNLCSTGTTQLKMPNSKKSSNLSTHSNNLKALLTSLPPMEPIPSSPAGGACPRKPPRPHQVATSDCTRFSLITMRTMRIRSTSSAL